MSESILATALAFARHGYAAFPVNWPVESGGRLVCSCGGESRGRPCTSAAKHPYGKLAPRGLRSATTESGIIKKWFGYDAPEANLGVVTDRLVVLDIDPRHGGDESLQALEREHGEMPPTWRALTGGGGEHVLFACPDGVAIASFAAEQTNDPPLGRGIDVRARDGYIVAPPSRHILGRAYTWPADHHPKDVPLALAPDWLITRLTAQATADSSAADRSAEPIPSDVWSQLTRQPISEYRDFAAAKIAGHLFRHNCDYQLVLGMLHAWNSAWCSPPLGYHELNRIVARIANREAARIEREFAR
jgi:Bifunctional DNA primase/polymerase, N-terminal/Primase C terminal 1 (PriCT-1)